MAKFVKWDDLFDFDDELFQDPFIDGNQLVVSASGKTKAMSWDAQCEVAKAAGLEFGKDFHPVQS